VEPKKIEARTLMSDSGWRREAAQLYQDARHADTREEVAAINARKSILSMFRDERLSERESKQHAELIEAHRTTQKLIQGSRQSSTSFDADSVSPPRATEPGSPKN
jgi:hypothetical protein